MACDTPFYVSINWQPDKVPVPCGRCPPCQTRRVSEWAFRLRKQEEISDSALFVTLTYNTTHVPISPKGFMNLCKRDFQLFMKRLRKLHSYEKITYYACGEYGSNSYRPHYHAIIFNAREDEVAKSWQLGEIHIGKVTGASIAYTLKYINKGKRIPLHKNDDRIPEFSLMSKGMGSNYLTPSTVNYHKSDLSKAYIKIENGIKIALPRYYKNKIYNEHEQKSQAFIVKKLAEENDQRSRREYIAINGTEVGYDEQIESGQRHRYERHRKQGLKNRKI